MSRFTGKQRLAAKARNLGLHSVANKGTAAQIAAAIADYHSKHRKKKFAVKRGNLKRMFEVTLGNLERRPGHRYDCAQIRAVAKVEAVDERDALSQIYSTLHDGESYMIDVHPGFTVEITFNADNVSKAVEVDDDS